MLTHLELAQNQLSGNIPAELGNLSRLQEFDLSSNQLSGSMPVELGNLSRLDRLFLHSNQLSGPLPENMTNLYPMRFDFSETALCEPPGLQTWLASIDELQSTGVKCN